MSRKRPAHLIKLWNLILLPAGCSQARVRPVATQTSGFVETGGRSVVDHFEDYGDISSNRICQAWLDGEGFSPDSHFPTGYGGNGTHAVVGHAVRTAGDPARGQRTDLLRRHPASYAVAHIGIRAEIIRTGRQPCGSVVNTVSRG